MIGEPETFWSQMSDTPPSAVNNDPFVNPGGFGVTVLSRSEEVVSYREFLIPALQVLERIYGDCPDYSEVVDHYAWPNEEKGLRVSAVGRGQEKGLPITFNNRAMAVCMRWMGQTLLPYKWTYFQFVFRWKEERYIVAEGNFTIYPTGSRPRALVGS